MVTLPYVMKHVCARVGAGVRDGARGKSGLFFPSLSEVRTGPTPSLVGGSFLLAMVAISSLGRLVRIELQFRIVN